MTYFDVVPRTPRILHTTARSGSCFWCDKGQTSRCKLSRVFGSIPLDGAQAEYVCVPLADTTLYPAPADVPPEAVILMADVSNNDVS